MKPIDRTVVEQKLNQFAKKEVFIHAEVNPGAFLRNVSVVPERLMIAGDGPYRVALQYAPEGWIRAENLTHYTVGGNGSLILSGYDEQGRIAVSLQIGSKPFTFNREEISR